ncbi:PRC-barrel domain-containing protein [Sphingomonas sp. BIUV-7]|uniref:PRC-barrel domain-containing protein n=1 Tax=Sphingomonas natans TaxID=3063330 RepID=A0ABT8Y624_9SPHN|nr:PRC-barrel domain-containing protein [Sphingomonas sp. BIUV-7]MDO6413771.1 PRC-barrel domain-containing protein [Sphingomonas sp. BIUV-7]
MLETIASYVAPAATMIAAMMTAANLGARVTGWGFVVFSIGAVAWIIDALATGQNNLLLSNAFLLLVDLVGIWRWLGRQSAYDDGAQAARDESAQTAKPTLFPIGALAGKPVKGQSGSAIGTAIEAMASCAEGKVEYIVVSRGGVGGVGETLHAIGWGESVYHDGGLETKLSEADLAARPALDRARWPVTAALAGAH